MRSTKRPASTITAPSRRPSIKAGGCLAIAAALTLSACGPDQAEPLPTPTDSVDAAAPVFASDDEALAAATAAYVTYVDAADEVSASGGQNVESLAPLVTAEYLEVSRREYAEFVELGVSTAGSTSFDTMALQSHVDDGNGNAEIIVYLCLDVTNVNLVNAQGSDVTPPERRNRLALEVTFEASPMPLISRSDMWTGSDFC